RAALVNTFIPIETEPTHKAELVFLAAFHIAFLVRIFNADNKLAALISSKQIVEKRRPRVSDMQMSCRTRRVADANFIPHVSLPLVILFQNHSSFFCRQTTACAAIPSSRPTTPSRSDVVAFTLTRSGSVSSSAAIRSTMCEM